MSDRDCKKCKHHTEKGCDSWDCKFEKRMTREEAIECNKNLKMYMKLADKNQPCKFREENYIALDMAINSLEIDERYELEYENAEEIHREKEQAYMQGYEDACKKYRQGLCGDAVSRMAINNLRKYNLVGGISTVSLVDVNKLPSVNPQYEQIEPCEDAIRRQAVLNILDDMTKDYAKSNDFEKVNGVAWVKVQNLPPVKPQESKTDVLNKIRDEIDRQEKWLLKAGYTAYNIDIAFDAIKSVLAESEDKE